MTESQEKVFKVESNDSQEKLISGYLPENANLVNELWKMENNSLLLGYIDVAVMNPVIDDLQERFAGQELGVSSLIVTEYPENLFVKGYEEFQVIPAFTLSNMDKVEEAARRGHIQPVGRAESLGKNNGEGHISSFGTGIVEGVGSMARKIVATEGCNIHRDTPALAIFNMEDKEMPKFLGVYPLDLTTLTPAPTE